MRITDRRKSHTVLCLSEFYLCAHKLRLKSVSSSETPERILADCLQAQSLGKALVENAIFGTGIYERKPAYGEFPAHYPDGDERYVVLVVPRGHLS